MATQTHISGDSEFEDILTQSIPLPILFASSNTPKLYVNDLTKLPIEIPLSSMSYSNGNGYYRYYNTKYIPN